MGPWVQPEVTFRVWRENTFGVRHSSSGTYELCDIGHVTSLSLSVPAFKWKQYSCLAEILEAETTWKAPVTELFPNLSAPFQGR